MPPRRRRRSCVIPRLTSAALGVAATVIAARTMRSTPDTERAIATERAVVELANAQRKKAENKAAEAAREWEVMREDQQDFHTQAVAYLRERINDKQEEVNAVTEQLTRVQDLWSKRQRNLETLKSLQSSTKTLVATQKTEIQRLREQIKTVKHTLSECKQTLETVRQA